ncbi:alpha/beta fold hydrolase [Spirosoma soli]|uniref:Alpha/beta fold hydrolase n=1 Tax=Spirosoma soli TaxID=1770529 RepID=A0ABW5M1U4_9BACT
MKRVWRVIGWGALVVLGLVLVFVGYIAWNSPGETSPILGSDNKPLPNSIAQLEAVQINGTTQWLLIRGHDRTKPVLLFLHGGPGLPELSLLSGHELEKQFVVVNWEQRGAGKSYSADVFNNDFTVNTFVDDAAEVSRLLARRFHQPKLFLMAHSWGTFLGILLVKKHPELFRAYFSISQIANQLEAEQISYDWVLQQAQQHEKTSQVRKLREQGRPPYPANAWLDYLSWQRVLVADYGGGMYRSNFYPLFIRSILLCPEYTLLDKIHYGFGAMETVRRLWPPVVDTDLFKVAPTLSVPYFLFQGIHDYQTPYPVASRYFNRVQAPQKRLFTFVNSAHSPIFEEPERFMQCLDSALRQVPIRTVSSLKQPAK